MAAQNKAETPIDIRREKRNLESRPTFKFSSKKGTMNIAARATKQRNTIIRNP